MSGQLPHAALVQAWRQGRELPPDVRAIMEWMGRHFPPGGQLPPAVLEALAAKGAAEGWRPEAIEGAMLLWHLSSTADAADKPAA